MGYVNVSISETVSVDLDEVLDEIDDHDLIAEIKDRGLQSEFRNGLKHTGEDVYTHKYLCDFFGVNYYTSIKELMKLFREKLREETDNIL